MVASSSTTASHSKKKPSRPSGSESQFPGKLHEMMQFVEEHSLESIISWELNGYGFKINDPEKLVTILPLFFGQTKYRSFRRQLNMWNFHRITLETIHKGTFIHPYFVKNDRELCAQMSRQIPFKPTQQKEREYVALASCIIRPNRSSKEEPSLPSSPTRNGTLDTKFSNNSAESINDTTNNVTTNGGPFQLSAGLGRLPQATSSTKQSIDSSGAQSPVRPLPGGSQQASKEACSSFTLDAVLKTIEDINYTVEGILDDSALSVLSSTFELDPTAAFDDELGYFEGMNFFFVDGDAAP